MGKKESNPIPEGAIRLAPPPPPPKKRVCEDKVKIKGIVPCSKCGSYAVGHYYYGFNFMKERSYIQCADCSNEVFDKTPKAAWEKWENENNNL